MNVDDFLGIDRSDPRQDLAARQVDEDDGLLDDLVARRLALGLTQTDVADRLGVSQSAVARFEGGDRDPHLSTLRRYALAVDCLVSHHVVPLETAVPRAQAAIQHLERYAWQKNVLDLRLTPGALA